MFLKVLGAAIISAAMAVAAPVQAKIYNFSGYLESVELNKPNPDWPFAVGQAFTGSIDFDMSRVTNTFDFDDQGFYIKWYDTPLSTISLSISTGSGNQLVQAKVGKDGEATSTVVVTDASIYNLNGLSAGGNISGINGDEVDIGFGEYLYYSLSFEMFQNISTGILVDPNDQNIDLMQIYNSLDPNDAFGAHAYLSVYNSYDDIIENKPSGAFIGKVTNFWEAPSSVPESPTWAMMILGFGAVGGAMRTRNRRSMAGATLPS